MTPEQKVNLLNHADFLEKIVPNQPGNRTFDMKYFVAVNGYTLEPSKFADEKPCGFSACAMGWAPLNPTLPPPQDGESWEDYSNRIFGIDYEEDEQNWPDCDGYNGSANSFSYCFDPDWPDDPVQAAERMREVAENPTNE